MTFPMRRDRQRQFTRRQMLGGFRGRRGTLMPSTFAKPSSAAQSDQTGDFRAMSWETEAEMRKWQLHIDKFVDNYPNMKVQIDYGISWEGTGRSCRPRSPVARSSTCAGCTIHAPSRTPSLAC